MHPTLERLKKYYWSPQPPSQCILDNGGGLGRIAHRDFGAFNVAWAIYKPKNETEHLNAIACFVHQQASNAQLVDGAELGSWLTLYRPGEFAGWYRKHKHQISLDSQARIEKALHALVNLRAL